MDSTAKTPSPAELLQPPDNGRLRQQSSRLALGMSMTLHLAVLVLVCWLLVANLPDGAADVDQRTGGIVLVDARNEVTDYLSEGDTEQTAAESPTSVNPTAAQEQAPELPGDRPPTESDLTGIGESIADTLADVNQFNLNSADPNQVGGRITTQVFGVSGTGSKFVYVFDRSESMSGFQKRPIKAAQQALSKSLDSLTESNQFQILFYNQDVQVFSPDGYPRLYFAEPDNLDQAKKFLHSVLPAGGTNHAKALEYAFKFAPDVIFLLTDAEVQGGFSAAQLARLGSLNRSKAIINTIEFGTYRGADRSLEKVSKASGGTYVFKNINSLKVQP